MAPHRAHGHVTSYAKTVMKELLILRHAKSSWDDPSLDDHERPLNERGVRDAPRMGKLIKQQKCIPDDILCSTSERTRQTIRYVCEACEYQGQTKFLDELYGTSVGSYVKIIQGIKDGFGRVMVVGHNPTLENLVGELSGQSQRFPTAALAYFQISITHWKDFSLASQVKLVDLWRPKEI